MKFKKRLSILLSFFFLFLLTNLANSYLHPAELHIKNTSQRHLIVKVMKQTSENSAEKYAIVRINSQNSETLNIKKTGYYYLKTKAVLTGRDPVYKKGDPFKAYVGSDGYSVLTITFSMQESSMVNPLSGKHISKADFDNDSN